MPSEYEDFWNKGSFAVVGHSGSKRKFPTLTYVGQKIGIMSRVFAGVYKVAHPIPIVQRSYSAGRYQAICLLRQ